MPRETKHFENVTIQHPETKHVMTCSAKLFDSIYKEKGYNEVSRENAKPGFQKTKNGGDKGPVSELGSAASIAKAIGLEGDDETPANNAENVVAMPPAARVVGEPGPTQKELETFAEDLEPEAAAAEDLERAKTDDDKSKNENDASSNKPNLSEPRQPKNRDRGRGNK